MTTQFDPRTYWEQRLDADWDLSGVGLQRLGRRFNAWAYRVRREVFLDVVAADIPDVAGARVLDVGSGTGFYVDRWREAGADEVVGVDLTDAAVTRLRRRYPTTTFVRADISAPLEESPDLRGAPFDAVSAMDVMFHIVDDVAFARAVANIRTLLRPGGTFLWSDLFVHTAENRVEHRVSRTLGDVEGVLAANGFDVVRRTPMFVLMNEPSDTRRAWTRSLWKVALGPASLAEPIGGFLGWALYPLETRLVRTRSESPTTEIMVCRAR